MKLGEYSSTATQCTSGVPPRVSARTTALHSVYVSPVGEAIELLVAMNITDAGPAQKDSPTDQPRCSTVVAA